MLRAVWIFKHMRTGKPAALPFSAVASWQQDQQPRLVALMLQYRPGSTFTGTVGTAAIQELPVTFASGMCQHRFSSSRLSCYV
jgi:hypothetical protein